MFNAYWQIRILDKNKMEKVSTSNISRSFCGNIISLFRVFMNNWRAGAAPIYVSDINWQWIAFTAGGGVGFGNVGGAALFLGMGLAKSGVYKSYTTVPAAADGERTGIVVGNSTAPENGGMNVMPSLITHGTGAGQLLYYGGVVTPATGPCIDGDDTYFDIKRVLKNESASAIEIKDIGLNIMCYTSTFFILRDLVGTITVDVNEYVEITYRLKVTV